MNRRKREQNARMKRRQAREIAELVAAVNALGRWLNDGGYQRAMEAFIRYVQQVLAKLLDFKYQIAARATQDPEFRQELRDRGLLEYFLPGYDGRKAV